MYQEITCSNGARLVTQRVPGVRSAALGFFVGAGSRHERAEENGAAHFVEHMLFKGTARRTAAQLAMDIDAIGGQVNAYTSEAYTCLYARCLDDHLDRCLDLLSDLLFHSRFAQEDVELERGVILEEVSMYEDTPDALVTDRLNGAVYKGSTLARTILGTQSTLVPMTGDFLRQWQRGHYHPGVIVAALAGSFSQAQEDRLRDCLSALEAGPPPAPAKPALYRPAVTARKKAIEQNHLILAYPALSFLDERRDQLALLNTLLGLGCSSRLNQEAREKRGLCYNIYSYVSSHKDTGLLGIYTAVGREQELPTLETIRQVVSELADHGPSQAELDRAREQNRANLLLSTEYVQSRMSHLGTNTLLYGRVREVDELLARLESVTREQVRELAGALFRPEQASLSAVGRVGSVQSYAQWLGR
ncbi:MAG: insulinase family protein [Lawsonibacter sp.]|nr:insulinase family protein [Lawsonibacter sp.]